jgi:uncharacterized protein Usg
MTCSHCGRRNDVDPTNKWEQLMSEMELMLKGYGLTTAEILYRLPDHPALLQSYLWQNYDLAPEFPEKKGFLKFWQEKLDGPLHSVRYVHRKLISASEWRAVNGEIILH